MAQNPKETRSLYGDQQTYEPSHTSDDQHTDKPPQPSDAQHAYGPTQAATAPTSPFDKISLGISGTTAGWLSYLFGWASGLFFIALEKQSRFVRFHAMQSILFFGGVSILQWILSAFPYFDATGSIIGVASLVIWVILMVSAGKGRYYKLPVIGNYAEKLADLRR